MADAYTSTTALANLVQTVYDRVVEHTLRAQPMFRVFADKRPEQVPMPGNAVVLNKYADLSRNLSSLTETTDPDAIAVPNTSPLTVSYAEYGKAVLQTLRLDQQAFSNVDSAVVDILSFNMREELDDGCQAVLRSGDNVIQNQAGTLTVASDGAGDLTAVAAGDDIDASYVRRAVTELRANKANPRDGSHFTFVIHPRVAHDLREATGAASWRQPQEYMATDKLWDADIGLFEGGRFIENNYCHSAVDGGATSNVRVFRTYALGRQALAEAVWEEPHVKVNPTPQDKLERLHAIYWRGSLNWAIYREPALFRIETSASTQTS